MLRVVDRSIEYLGDVRNELTHHSLSDLATFTEDYRLYLPSDPLRHEYKRERRYEIPIYLKALRDNAYAFLEEGYKVIWDYLQSQASK